jgi:hypothetical protein
VIYAPPCMVRPPESCCIIWKAQPNYIKYCHVYGVTVDRLQID